MCVCVCLSKSEVSLDQLESVSSLHNVVLFQSTRQSYHIHTAYELEVCVSSSNTPMSTGCFLKGPVLIWPHCNTLQRQQLAKKIIKENKRMLSFCCNLLEEMRWMLWNEAFNVRTLNTVLLWGSRLVYNASVARCITSCLQKLGVWVGNDLSIFFPQKL